MFFKCAWKICHFKSFKFVCHFLLRSGAQPMQISQQCCYHESKAAVYSSTPTKSEHWVPTLQTQRPSWAGTLRASPQGSWIKWLSNAYAGHRCRQTVRPWRKGVVKRGCGCGCWWYYYLRSRWQRLENRGRNCQLSACRAFTIHRWTHR